VDAGQLIGFDLPHRLALLIYLEDVLVAPQVAAGDEGVAVGQANDAVGAAQDRGQDIPTKSDATSPNCRSRLG
jgi:hypothetical protein